jgi:antitoxin CptB
VQNAWRANAAWKRFEPMDRETRLKRLKFRAEHRGTREADMLIGGFFAAHGEGWDEAAMDWFEALLEEQDVDLLAWAMGSASVPERWRGPLMDAFCRLDYVKLNG